MQTDALGRILSCSPEAALLLQCPARSAVGRDLLEFFPDHSTTLAAALIDLRRAGAAQALDVTLRPGARAALPATVLFARTPSDTVHWILISDT